jgi:uncharacterized phage-associated protein
MAKHTANEVADAFLALCHDYGDYLSNQKLSRLLYFAQGWHVALYGEPLFDDEFEAWVHGPTVAAVFERFRPFDSKPLGLTPPKSFDDFPPHLREHLEDVWKAYGSLSSYELTQISRSERPWQHARAGVAVDEGCRNKISIADIRETFEEKNRTDEQEQDGQREDGARKRSA